MIENLKAFKSSQFPTTLKNMTSYMYLYLPNQNNVTWIDNRFANEEHSRSGPVGLAGEKVS